MPKIIVVNESMFFIALIIIILTSAFIILLMGKIGLRTKIIFRAPRLISKLFDCDFCLSFWISMILAIILAIIFSNLIFLFIPILSTPIIRILI